MSAPTTQVRTSFLDGSSYSCSSNSSDNLFFGRFFKYFFHIASRSLEVLTGLLDQLEEEELAAEAQEEGFAEDDG